MHYFAYTKSCNLIKPSPKSQQIRATFVKQADLAGVPLEVQRREWEEAAAQVQLPADITVTPLSLGGIQCERVQRANCDQTKVLLYLHGGGFVSGSCKTHRDLAARLALTTAIPILLVDYRLAPEHPFPAAVEDVTRVYQGLQASGTAAAQVVIGGDSAGGGLAMSVLLSWREQGMSMPASAILISPWADLAVAGESLLSRADVDLLISQEELRICAKDYVGNSDTHNPLLSPVYANLHGLPPLLIYVGDHEILLSDSLRLAERAQAAGIDLNLEVWPEMWHVWPAWAASLPEGQAALNQIGGYVRQTLLVRFSE